MHPTAAAALRWGGAVVGLLLVVWFTVPAMLNAMASSVQFGDEDEASVFLEGGDPEDDADGAEPTGDEPAEEDADDGNGNGNGDGGEGDGDGNGNGDGGEGDGDGNGNGDGGEGDGGTAAAGGTYEVQTGDTLYSIAEQVLGDGNRWTEIAELNGLTDGRDLRVGQELDVPGD